MSGTNRLVISENTKNKGTISSLSEALKNANEVALKINKPVSKKKK